MPVTSPKHAAAARRNGRLPRGPEAHQGKAHACGNALKPGLRAVKVVPNSGPG